MIGCPPGGRRRRGNVALEPTGDPEADVLELALAVRSFARRAPHLHEVMFSRPFAEFRPDAAIGLFATVQGLLALDASQLLGSGPEAADPRFRLTFTAALRGLAAAASQIPRPPAEEAP
jgi:hypothetical protein